MEIPGLTGPKGRIQQALDGAGVTATALAEKLAERMGEDVFPSVTTSWVCQKGPRAPSARYLVLLPEVLGVSGHWLLTGDGPMRPPNPNRETRAFREIAALVDRVREEVPEDAPTA